MENFKELCESYKKFINVVETKTSDYCTIHNKQNPFLEDLEDIIIE